MRTISNHASTMAIKLEIGYHRHFSSTDNRIFMSLDHTDNRICISVPGTDNNNHRQIMYWFVFCSHCKDTFYQNKLDYAA